MKIIQNIDRPVDSHETSSEPDSEIRLMREFADYKVRMALVDRFRELEFSGKIYTTNVEIVFPPQVKAICGLDGLVVETRRVLELVACDLLVESPERALMFHRIAEEFYAQEEDEDDDRKPSDFDLLDDELDALEATVQEFEARSQV
jgi:hypothetical protein